MDDETSGAPPAAAGAEVPSGADEGATPPRPSPTVRAADPQRGSSGDGPSGGSSKTLWIVLLVIVLAAAAAAALWFFVLRPKNSTPAPTPSPTAFAWAGKWARSDGGGGGVVVQQSGNLYRITVYGSQLQAVGVATGQLTAGTLPFTLQAQQEVAGLSGPLTVTLTPGPAGNQAQMLIASPNHNSVSLGLRRAASLLPASPSATASASASASPTVSPSPSPSGSVSADQQVINGVVKIKVGVITWSTNNNNLYPPVNEVSRQGTVAQYATPWPTNPYTSQPMKAGTQAGDYVYKQLNGGQAYSITGYLANGYIHTVP